MEGEGGEIKSKQASKRVRTLCMYIRSQCVQFAKSGASQKIINITALYQSLAEYILT